MAISEIILIAGISLSILLLILSGVYLFQFILSKKEIKKLSKDRPKDKKKRRRWKRKVNELENKKTKKLRGFIFSLLATLIIGGGSAYAKFYIATNISDEDTDNIVYGYFLLDQLEQQIKDIDKGNEQKVNKNVHVLSVSISSFSSKKGDNRGVEEAQILLNQYYSKLGQFGLNMTTQNMTELRESKEKQEECLADIKTVKTAQKKVMDYYKIDESSLKQKK